MGNRERSRQSLDLRLTNLRGKKLYASEARLLSEDRVNAAEPRRPDLIDSPNWESRNSWRITAASGAAASGDRPAERRTHGCERI